MSDRVNVVEDLLPDGWKTMSVADLVAEKVIEKPLDGNHGGTHPKSSDYVEHGIPFVMANSFASGRVDLTNCKFITKARADKLQKGFAISGDVLLTHKGTVGSTAVVGPLETEYIMLTPQVTYYRVTDATRLNSFFLRHYFDSGPFQSLFVSLAGGGTRAYLGIVRQLALPIICPPVREQSAIAEALNDADALLGALDRLIAKKRDLKQAAMHQLLSGQTRLPGFRGAWGTSTIGREFEVKLGKMLDADRNVGVPKPFLGNRAVQWGQIDISDISTVPMTPSDMEAFGLRNGDLLVCEGGEVGRAAIWNAPIPECYYQKALHRLRPTRGFEPRVMAALFRLWVDRGVLANYVTQTSIAHLPREKLLLIPLPVPSPPEQSAIADVLSDMDADLATLEQRRDKTRAIKQGMMQELLTGRIRLV